MEQGFLHKIGQAAEILNVSIRTIRYYEELGLIDPLRTKKGTRLYSDEDIKRLKTSLTLKEHGMSLDEVVCLAKTREKYNTGQEASGEVLQILNSLQSKVIEQKLSYQILEKDLDCAILLVRQCSNCKRPPTSIGCPNCPVATHRNESTIAGLIWDNGKKQTDD